MWDLLPSYVIAFPKSENNSFPCSIPGVSEKPGYSRRARSLITELVFYHTIMLILYIDYYCIVLDLLIVRPLSKTVSHLNLSMTEEGGREARKQASDGVKGRERKERIHVS